MAKQEPPPEVSLTENDAATIGESSVQEETISQFEVYMPDRCVHDSMSENQNIREEIWKSSQQIFRPKVKILSGTLQMKILLNKKLLS